MTDEPTLGRGHQNPHEWVQHVKTLINRARTPMDTRELPENGVFDEATEEEVRDFQHRMQLPVDGVVGPKTWAALQTAVMEKYERQQQAGEIEAGLRPDPDAQAHHEDPPPAQHEIEAGQALIQWFVDDIHAKAHEFADNVIKLGKPHEVLPKLVDAADWGVASAEIFGVTALTESALFVGAGAALPALSLFAMWYEVALANFEGQLHEYRWQVYRPFSDGLLAGLYDTSPPGVDHFFAPVRDAAYAQASGRAPQEKKGAIGALLVRSSYGRQHEGNVLTAHDWINSGYDHGWTAQGLEIALSHNDG